MTPLHLKATGKRRLLKLIDFLEKLPRKQFNFESVVEDYNRKNECATVACAIGWTPKLFPRMVRWEVKSDCFRDAILCVVPSGVTGSTDSQQQMHEAAWRLFGIDRANSYIFAPNMQTDVHDSLPLCGYSATPKQVARMLRKFIKLCEKGEIQ